MSDQPAPPVNSSREVEPPIPDPQAEVRPGDELLDALTGEPIGGAS